MFISHPNVVTNQMIFIFSSFARPNHSPSITTTIESISTNEIPPLQSTIEYATSISEVQETIEYLLDQCCNILSEVNTPQTSSIDNTSDYSKRQRKINKLEHRLHKLSKTIRELEEKDMSLEEMATCNLYVVESELKKQAYEVHAKLAKLKSQSSSIERIIHQPITLNGNLIFSYSLFYLNFFKNLKLVIH